MTKSTKVFSDKERKLLSNFVNEPILQAVENGHLAVHGVYHLALQNAFLSGNCNSEAAWSLRSVYNGAFVHSNVYRMTPEFDNLIIGI